jgi:hypothetical protein
MQDDFPLNKMKKEDELIIRYLDQNLSEEEIQILDQSLRENSVLRKKFYDQVNVGTCPRGGILLEITGRKSDIF